jgi:hypothetical protein
MWRKVKEKIYWEFPLFTWVSNPCVLGTLSHLSCLVWNVLRFPFELLHSLMFSILKGDDGVKGDPGEEGKDGKVGRRGPKGR